MKNILSIAGLDLPAITPNHKLTKILNAALRDRQIKEIDPLYEPPWNAESFGLNSVSLFQESSDEEQTNILQIASQGLLSESCFIEKAGVGYMSKMTLMAETTEERMLYALFSADEAMHLAQLKPLIRDHLSTYDPFLQILESLLEKSDRTVLIFVIQVVLEGWGLSHYRSLSKSCCNPELSKMFHSFLQAEAKHHSAGVTLFDSDRLTAASQNAIVDTLAAFLQMVRVGPQRVLGAIALTKGGLSRTQAVTTLSELETERHSGRRLSLLRSLIAPTAPSIAEILDSKSLFSPLPPSQCLVEGTL